MRELELIELRHGTGEGGGRGKVLSAGPFQKTLERPVVGIWRPSAIGAGGERWRNGAAKAAMLAGETVGKTARGATLRCGIVGASW